MNSLVQWSQKILPMLRRLEEGQIEPQDALQECICIIKEVLSDYGVPQNIQNAGQIANLINAHISPDDPLSKWMWPRIESGKLPEFSTNDPTENALERGVAILMSSMQ